MKRVSKSAVVIRIGLTDLKINWILKLEIS